jgi:hypothetical protein
MRSGSLVLAGLIVTLLAAAPASGAESCASRADKLANFAQEFKRIGQTTGENCDVTRVTEEQNSILAKMLEIKLTMANCKEMPKMTVELLQGMMAENESRLERTRALCGRPKGSYYVMLCKTMEGSGSEIGEDGKKVDDRVIIIDPQENRAAVQGTGSTFNIWRVVSVDGNQVQEDLQSEKSGQGEKGALRFDLQKREGQDTSKLGWTTYTDCKPDPNYKQP